MNQPQDNITLINLSSIDYDRYSNKLSQLEINILKEYQSINNNLKLISKELESIIGLTNENDNNNKSTNITVENLRQIESKVGFIYTFFKSAVYTLYTEHEGDDDGRDDEEEEEEYVEEDSHIQEKSNDEDGNDNTELSDRSNIA
ncbi:unnamed protein product [Candida verbasci]|uniref:DASH complex subunit DAD3 n=1 Tax=Candida verbasci TaxID=1227364 RepID=A0A9W4TSF3_9ASCO|nr:unnamed protein product [Candida verbasci]